MGGKTSVKSVNKYIARVYDRVNLTMPKGKKEELRQHAAQRGETVNGFITRAIAETIARDNAGEAAPSQR